MFKFSRLRLVILPVVVLLALVTSRAVVSAENLSFENETQYIVRAGDDFWTIGFRFKVNPLDLAEANNMDLSEPLLVGQKLAIPESEPVKTHRVRAGESLWSIAGQHGIPLSLILRANRVSDPDKLQVGQVLNLPVTYTRASRGTSIIQSGPPISFAWPLTGTITSGYGWRKGEFHEGVDVAAERGTDICAARDGLVVFAGWSYGYGRTVKIDHGDGYSTLYAHASKTLVEVGEQVSAGQAIAKVGSTGRSTGPHLHFEVRYGTTPMNPINFLNNSADTAEI